MDLLTDDSGDLVIQNGDLAIASKKETDRMYVRRILYHEAGTFIFDPQLGAGLKKEINSPLPEEELRRRAKVNLEADGFEVHETGFDPPDEFVVNATRRQNDG